MRADLHCHSTASDGSLSPFELVQLAKKQNLWGLSITDHDTIEAYKTAIAAAQECGIHLGAGVEFSCDYQGFSIHVLGYDFLLTEPMLQDFCLRHQTRRKERNRAILDKLFKYGFKIDEQELLNLSHHKTVGRPHIAEELVKKGYVTSIQEAFNQYLGDGKPCYAPGTPFSIGETLAVIHKAGGKAFIAHPHLLSKKVSLNDLLKFPFDGIECFYSRFSQEAAQPWVKIVQEKKWLISGGSDFHGQIKPDILLGSSFVRQEEFEKIFEHPLS